MRQDGRVTEEKPEPDGASAAGAPRPGVKPGAKRRRTASMRVSRPEPEVAGGAEPTAQPARGDSEPEPERPGPFDGAWVQRLREFLDSTPGRVVLAVSAVAGLLLGPTAIYSVFAVVFLFRRRLRPLVARLPLGPRTTLGVLIVLAGLLREVLSWTAEYVQGDQTVLLWHPQLVPDLLIGVGIFLGWALGWAAALRWYRYRLIEVLFIQAVYGLVIENFGQSLIIGITTLPSGLLLLLYAVMLSSCTVGTAWLLAEDKLATLPAKETGSFRYAAPPVLITLAIVLILMVWGQALAAVNGIPDPAPIRERPFW